MHTIKSQNAESLLTPRTTQRAVFAAPRRTRSFSTPKTVDGRCRDCTQRAAAVSQSPTAAQRPVDCKAGFTTPAVTPGAEDGCAESAAVAPDGASGGAADFTVTCAAVSGVKMGATVSTGRAADVERDAAGSVCSTSGAAVYAADEGDTTSSEAEILDKFAKVSYLPKAKETNCSTP